MRGLPGVVEGIARALPIFERHGLWPTANLGINRLTGGEPLALAEGAGEAERQEFEERSLAAFRAFYRKVLDLGLHGRQLLLPDERRVRAGARARSRIPRILGRLGGELPARREGASFRALDRAVEEFRPRLRIFTPRSMLHSLVREYRDGEPHGYACRGGLDFFFVAAADGEAYPCGFRSHERLGKYWEALTGKGSRSEAHCRSCDWECFRDPSNLAGPLLEARSRPWALLARWRRDPEWARLWRGDLAYQRACDYFDGRLPPEPRRLGAFAPGGYG